MGWWEVWLLVFLSVSRIFSSMANKAAHESGHSSDSSTSFPLDHVDDDDAQRCRNLVGGVHAFHDLPNQWQRFVSSATAPCLPFPFLSNKLRHALCFPSVFVLLHTWWPKQDLLEVISKLRLVDLYVLVVLPGLAVTVAERGVIRQDLKLPGLSMKLFFGVHPQRPCLADVMYG
jgi:hypothetical protein